MKTIYLSENANNQLIDYLKNKDFSVKLIKGAPHINTGIKTHPDIYMCKLGIRENSPIYFGNQDRLREKYPLDIIYNAACTGKYFIHKLNSTDEKLLKKAAEMGFQMINTRQGYTKCSLAVVDENSVITSDKGTANILINVGLDVLLISQGHILLKGYDWGFIGGTCGIVEDEMIFNGNLSAHPDFENIRNFIASKGLNLKYFKEYPLEDIGSIICE